MKKECRIRHCRAPCGTGSVWENHFAGGFIQWFGNANGFRFIVAVAGVQGLAEAAICRGAGASVSYAL